LIFFFVYELLEKFYHLTGLPNRLGELFDERARKQIGAVLEKMGITIRMADRLNIALNVEEAREHPPARNYRDACLQLLKSFLVRGDYIVGERNYLPQKQFLDVMSASLHNEKCVRLASFLHELYKEALKKNPDLATASAVVGIKRGSPTLAYEFAKSRHLPLVLHRGSDEFRYNAPKRQPRDTFDGDLSTVGKTVLIVDDSITGGRMVIEAIVDLGRLDIDVAYCLVLFEVLGKEGRQALSDNHVELIPIFRYDGANKVLENAPLSSLPRDESSQQRGDR
jgi:orotate phosphoribosyltransferase